MEMHSIFRVIVIEIQFSDNRSTTVKIVNRLVVNRSCIMAVQEKIQLQMPCFSYYMAHQFANSPHKLSFATIMLYHNLSNNFIAQVSRMAIQAALLIQDGLGWNDWLTLFYPILSLNRLAYICSHDGGRSVIKSKKCIAF